MLNGPNTVEIFTRAPLSYWLITVKEYELEKILSELYEKS